MMGIQVMDVIGKRRLLMVILSNGTHAFVVGQNVERAARLVENEIGEELEVIAVFDGFNMYTCSDWDE